MQTIKTKIFFVRIKVTLLVKRQNILLYKYEVTIIPTAASNLILKIYTIDYNKLPPKNYRQTIFCLGFNATFFRGMRGTEKNRIGVGWSTSH